MNKNNKLKSSYLSWIFLFLFILIGLITYTYGLIHFSRSRQLTEMADTIVSTNPNKISKIVVDENNKPINPQKLKPLTKLYRHSPQKRILMREKVISAADSGNVQIVQNGKILGIYPRYRVLIKPILFTLKTNLNHPSFNINEDPVEFYGTKKKLNIKRLPGKYTFRCLGESGKKKKDLKQSVAISPVGDKPIVSFYVTPPVKKHHKKDFSKILKEHARPFTDILDDDTISFKDARKLPNDPNLRNKNQSLKGLIGKWKQSTGSFFKFNHNGTFVSNNNSGKYKVVYRNKDNLNIQFTHSNGTKTVQPFNIKNNQLIETNMRLRWRRT